MKHLYYYLLSLLFVRFHPIKQHSSVVATVGIVIQMDQYAAGVSEIPSDDVAGGAPNVLISIDAGIDSTSSVDSTLRGSMFAFVGAILSILISCNIGVATHSSYRLPEGPHAPNAVLAKNVTSLDELVTIAAAANAAAVHAEEVAAEATAAAEKAAAVAAKATAAAVAARAAANSAQIAAAALTAYLSSSGGDDDSASPSLVNCLHFPTWQVAAQPLLAPSPHRTFPPRALKDYFFYLHTISDSDCGIASLPSRRRDKYGE